MQLTGPPRIGRILMPFASKKGAVEVEWPEDGSVVFKNLSQSIEEVETHLRGKVTIRWAALAPDVAAALIRELQEPPVTVVPRTRAEGDPAYVDEVFLQCRLASALPATHALYRDDVDIETELETKRTFSAVPGIGEPPAPAIEHGEHVDLLGGVQGTGEPPTTWRATLPYPGRLVRLEAQEAGDVTVRLYDASGTQLGSTMTMTAEAGEAIYVDLLEDVHELEVETSGERPVATLDADTYALTLEGETASTYTFETHGKGHFETVSYEYTTVMGRTVTLTDYVFRPAALGAGRVVETGTYSATIIIDT
jgi:hypothetical protein